MCTGGWTARRRRPGCGRCAGQPGCTPAGRGANLGGLGGTEGAWWRRCSLHGALSPPTPFHRHCRCRHCRRRRAPWTCLLLQDKAHKLGDILVRQELQTKDLQRQLATLQEAQAAALAAATADDATQLSDGDLSAMRQQLLLAQAQLQQQSEELEGVRADYDQRQALLQGAAGAAALHSLACMHMLECHRHASQLHAVPLSCICASEPAPPFPASRRCCPAGGAGAAGCQPGASGGGGAAAAAE